MLTFGTGLILPPAQDQQASASDFSFGMEFPASIPSGISGPEASYVPDSLLGLLEIEENNSEPEPEPDDLPTHSKLLDDL